MDEHAHWLGRREEADDVCALPLVRRVAALLDRDPAALQEGDELPTGWHVVLFAPATPQGGLGADGHPLSGGLLPPAPLPRRMLGGRRTRFAGPLRIGAAVRRVSEIAGVRETQGRSGRLLVLTLRHTIGAADQSAPAVIEEQDILYREAARPGAVPPPLQETERPVARCSRDFTPDPVLLFRYSAITFNAHRIHYDQAYATEREGYPGLIVNGGLTALLLLELLKEASGAAPAAFAVRNRRPLICGRPARLCVAQAASGWTLWAADERGRVALDATAA